MGPNMMRQGRGHRRYNLLSVPRLGKQSQFQEATRTFSPVYPHQLGRHIARRFTIRIERLSLRETEQSITRGRRLEEGGGSLAHSYPSVHTADEFWPRTGLNQSNGRRVKNTRRWEGITSGTVRGDRKGGMLYVAERGRGY